MWWIDWEGSREWKDWRPNKQKSSADRKWMFLRRVIVCVCVSEGNGMVEVRELWSFKPLTGICYPVKPWYHTGCSRMNPDQLYRVSCWDPDHWAKRMQILRGWRLQRQDCIWGSWWLKRVERGQEKRTEMADEEENSKDGMQWEVLRRGWSRESMEKK